MVVIAKDSTVVTIWKVTTADASVMDGICPMKILTMEFLIKQLEKVFCGKIVLLSQYRMLKLQLSEMLFMLYWKRI